MADKKKVRKGAGAEARNSSGSPLLNWALAILFAVAGGVLIVLSFPTYDLFPLGWLGPVFLLLAVRGRGFGGAFLLGLLTGFITNLGGFYWISNMLQDFAHMQAWSSWLLACLLAMVQGLVYAFGAGVAAGVTRRFRFMPWILVFPVVYTAVEFAFPMIFPWYLANGQQHFTAAIQIADLFGAPGITFLVVLVATAIADIAASRIGRTGFPIVQTIIALIAFAASIGYGIMRIEQIDSRVAAAPKFKVGIVEADIGIWEKEAQNPDGSQMDGAAQMAMLYSNLLKHQYLSREIEQKHKPDLIVWPESSYFPLYRVFAKRTTDTAMAVSLGGTLYGFGPDGISQAPDTDIGIFRDTGLRAITALNEEDVLAVGPGGAIYHFDGRTWTREKTDTDRDLNAVAWHRAGLGAMAVGDNGVVLTRLAPGPDESGRPQAATWKTIDTGRFESLRGVVDTEEFGWVACGDGGTLFGMDGEGGVKSLVPAGMPDLTGVDWTPDAGLVAVGHQGIVLRVTGPNEVTSEQPTRKTLRAVAAGSTTWAVGDDGEAVACTSTCRQIPTGVRRALNSVAIQGGERAVAVGEDGTVVDLSAGAARPARAVEGARGRLVGVTDIPFTDAYPYPLDTKKVYVARTPLPAEGSWQDPGAGYQTDRKTPAADRNSVMRGFSTPLIYGAASMERFPQPGREPIKHNTAMMIDGDGNVLGMYFKNRLLVFGEYLPLERYFPVLRKWLPEAGDWTPGDGPSLFELGPARIGISICYEGLLAGFHRDLAEKAPNLLVNITNDAWFGRTHEPWLHLQLAELRTVESRTFMARSTNTGISAIIDPVGRRVSHTALENAEYLIGDVALTGEKTFYIRHGDLFALACCGLSLVFAGMAVIARRKS